MKINPFDFDYFFQKTKELRSASGAIKKYAVSGFRSVPDFIHNERRKICESCTFWDKDGWNGYGKCLKCGCSGIKLKFPLEKCPIGLWGDYNIDTK